MAVTYPPGSVRALIESDLVTAPTRRALSQRLARADVARSRVFDAGPFATLRAVCARLIPQLGRQPAVDLAGELDRRLAENSGSGWRYAIMPEHTEMHVRGLRGLNETAEAMFARPFVRLTGVEQDAVLGAVQGGTPAGVTWRTLKANCYFEELLAAMVDIYYAHPVAMEEIGHAGMADAHGWAEVGTGAREAHEPVPLPAVKLA